MEQGDFESLVSRMEQLAREKPKPYRRRVFLLAGLGYAYLAVVILVLLMLTVAAIASISKIGILGSKLVAVVAVLLIAVVRGLWVRLAPPSGEAVTGVDAPELFRLLNALRVRLKTAPIPVVLITPDFSAGVAQVPRLGLFGWHRYWPAMIAATKDPAKGSVAPFAGFVAQGVRSVPETELKSWVTAALKQVTSHEDTHPSLTDRLKAMGAPAEFAPPGPGEGAEKLLGSSLARLEKKFDAAWNKLAAREARPYFPEAPRR